MTEVVSIKFKVGGKNYYFNPNGLKIEQGDRVVVETANGMELAECSRGNHMVEDTSVVLPLRVVLRKATEQDLRQETANRAREKEALGVCREKAASHGLEMKIVDVECSFDGSKTTFYFTADGRVDFRELVKDLAAVYHNRIELRQIGIRDEAKMIGGLGICGRPFCCSQFLSDFAPVSTKMAKTQNLPLNPTKISGSCGRLMCCLRYEEDAYADLQKRCPKTGAFVETIDGYGTVESVNLLRERVSVRLDSDPSGDLHVLKVNQVATVPGGRPPEGTPLPHVLEYDPTAEDEGVNDTPDEGNEWEALIDFEKGADAPSGESQERAAVRRQRGTSAGDAPLKQSRPHRKVRVQKGTTQNQTSVEPRPADKRPQQNPPKGTENTTNTAKGESRKPRRNNRRHNRGNRQSNGSQNS